MRRIPWDALAQVLGIVLVVVGVALIYLPAAWIVGGGSLLALGVALERSRGGDA